MGDVVRLEPGGYSARKVADLLGLSMSQLRAYVRAGVLSPARGGGGELTFSFQDLAFLRQTLAAMPPRKVVRALRHVKGLDRPLSSVRIAIEGDHLIVRDGERVWDPRSGQLLIDFAPGATDVTPLQRPSPALDADEWYEIGCALEEADPARAREAFEKAVSLDPGHADALIDLGRLAHAAGEVIRGAACYAEALRVRPDDAVAAFNLGVALEDLGREEAAKAAYERALGIDPACADAHYNLARLADRRGDQQLAIRHLAAYRRLTEGAR
jgi:tetratricopeptide (TPR) repeat protein